jgi:hypothetical protein
VFVETCFFHLQGIGRHTLKNEPTDFSVSLVCIYENALCHISEDHNSCLISFNDICIGEISTITRLVVSVLCKY